MILLILFLFTSICSASDIGNKNQITYKDVLNSKLEENNKDKTKISLEYNKNTAEEKFEYCSNIFDANSCTGRKKVYKLYFKFGAGLVFPYSGGRAVSGYVPFSGYSSVTSVTSYAFSPMFGLEMRYNNFYQAVELGFRSIFMSNDHYNPSTFLSFEMKYIIGAILDIGMSSNVKIYGFINPGIGNVYNTKTFGSDLNIFSLPEGSMVGSLFGGPGLSIQINNGLEVGGEIAFGSYINSTYGFFNGLSWASGQQFIFYPSLFVKVNL